MLQQSLDVLPPGTVTIYIYVALAIYFMQLMLDS